MNDQTTPALRARAEARLGSTLKGKWRLDQLLGVGGMAAVFSATHRNGARVAIKILYPELAMRSDLSERFAREGYVANKVNHPGTVRVLDDDVSEEGEPFLVMDLLEGVSLEVLRRRRGGRLPVDEVLAIADGILDVLAAAHAAGIIHRDIKPQNVFVLPSEGAVRIKLLDFGVARLTDGSVSSTMSGGVLGTPAFMAPEQAAGRASQVDARSDLWAVGATMFKLMSGRFVHQAENMQAHLVMAAITPAPPLASLAPDVAADVTEIVDRALAFQQAGRFSDARSMQTAVRAAMVTRRGALASVPTVSLETPSSAPIQELTASNVLTLRTPTSTAPDAIPPSTNGESAFAAPSMAAHTMSHSLNGPSRGRARLIALAGVAAAVSIAAGLFFGLRSPRSTAPTPVAASPPVSIAAPPPEVATQPAETAAPPVASTISPIAPTISRPVAKPPNPAPISKPVSQDQPDPMSRRKF